jgi:hypothetical protein
VPRSFVRKLILTILHSLICASLVCSSERNKKLQADLDDATGKLEKATITQKTLKKHLKKAGKDLADADSSMVHIPSIPDFPLHSPSHLIK